MSSHETEPTPSPTQIEAHGAGPLRPGMVLEDRYEIEQLLGQGAMGYVYRARQLRLQRAVAIKVPRSALAQDPAFMARFEREALTMARCVHENVTAVFDVSVAKEPGHVSFIAMELVSGMELDRFLRAEEANLTIRAVLDIIRQAARGIDAAHAAGIVHRDIKPSNMIVTMPQRVVKLMDFGIARAPMEGAQLTQTSQAMGTPAYMAPEQIRGEKVGPPADVYAFAATVYKLLARRLPFDGETVHTLLFKHLNSELEPISSLNANWPRALDEALSRGMHKDPEKRTATATQLANEIEAALAPYASAPLASFYSGTPIATAAVTPIPAPPPAPKRGLWLGIAALAVAAGGVFAGLALRGGEKPPAASAPPPAQPTPAPTAAPRADAPPAIATATPEPAPTPRAAAPEATPRPTPTAAPTRTPRPTRATAPTEVPTPEPTVPDDGYTWGEELRGSARVVAVKAIDELVLNGIRRPIFRGELPAVREAFADVDPAERSAFLGMIEALLPLYDDITLRYQRTGERIDGTRAEVRMRVGLRGKRRNAGRAAREETILADFDAVATFRAEGKQWILTSWPAFHPDDR
jgi:serine/threonine-protein kinase